MGLLLVVVVLLFFVGVVDGVFPAFFGGLEAGDGVVLGCVTAEVGV